MNLPANAGEAQVLSLGWKDPLEKDMALHSSILAWRIPNGQRNLVGYSPWGPKEMDMTKVTEHKHKKDAVCFLLFLAQWLLHMHTL